jgi:hypothetical protein
MDGLFQTEQLQGDDSPRLIALRARRRAIVIPMLMFALVPLVRAQDIRIKVLDGRNGKPASQECLNISIGTWHGADLVVETDKDGIALLQLGNDELVPQTACQGWPLRASAKGIQSIVVVSGSSVTCQEYGKVAHGESVTLDVQKRIIPSYSIKEIMQSGVAAANTCGKTRAQPQPGELILFVRPFTLWEKLKM